MEQNQIVLTDEEGNELRFYVLGETTLQEKNYLLVSDSEDDEEAECDIMLRTGDGEDYCTYSFVEDDEERENVFHVFEALLSDEEMED